MVFSTTSRAFAATSRALFKIQSDIVRHENPLGLPRRGAPAPPPTLPRAGIPKKRGIPNVKHVVAVASGKGGVGKSTVAVNLAMALATHGGRSWRVGLLDLDIFGPSIPKLMGLENVEEPALTESGAIVPLINHGMQCMSIGFLLPATAAPDGSRSSVDTPVVWRGLMVQKAVQQLLFDVDWRESPNSNQPGSGLDILVVDLPPGTGDVLLTLGQLVEVSTSVVVSTPQDVSLSDVRKGLALLRKLSIPVTGTLLNSSYFICPSCTTRHYLYGKPDSFNSTSELFDINILGELPVVPDVSLLGDKGVPFMLSPHHSDVDTKLHPNSLPTGAAEWKQGIVDAASKVWEDLSSPNNRTVPNHAKRD